MGWVSHRSASDQPPDPNRLLVTADRHVAERGPAGGVADRPVYRIRDQELRAELLVETFYSRRKIYRVADHGVFLAARRPDVAGHHIAEMNPDTDAQRPITADVVLLNRGQHLAPGGDRP